MKDAYITIPSVIKKTCILKKFNIAPLSTLAFNHIAKYLNTVSMYVFPTKLAYYQELVVTNPNLSLDSLYTKYFFYLEANKNYVVIWL